jgi:hypothetical protein
MAQYSKFSVQIALFFAFMMGATAGFAQSETSEQKNASGEMVRFFIQNNSLLPRKLAIISYEPKDNGSNGTQIVMYAPFGKKSFRFPVGTRVYAATSDQVNVVMGGNSIRTDEPLLTVTTAARSKTFNAN